MVVRSRDKRARLVSRLWFRGVQVDLAQVTYADVHRGVLRGFCVDERGAKFIDYAGRALQRFEARGRIRIQFKRSGDLAPIPKPAATALWNLGVGRADIAAHQFGTLRRQHRAEAGR